MPDQHVTRRLAAIVVADVVGYSKLIGRDEAGTLAQLAALRADVIEPLIGKHAGRLFKSVGDGFLIEFASAVQAVSCAKAIQGANGQGHLALRIGVHVGDVVVQGDDLMGDGVNVAARVESVAEPGGIAITRSVHEQVRDKLDFGFLDKGEVELKNIQRPVQVFVVAGTKGDTQPIALAPAESPSIAVLPFQNMSDDPEQGYLAHGIVEDIITALSRFRALFVAPHGSSFSFRETSLNVRDVGLELGVRYVLEGSVQKAGSRVRITGRLIDCENGRRLWADRFEGAAEDAFDLQDRVATAVVGAIVPTVDHAELERARRRAPKHAAYDFYLRGLQLRHDERTRASIEEALNFFCSAIELEPEFSPALAMAISCHSIIRSEGWSDHPQMTLSEIKRLATVVARMGQPDAMALAIAGHALGWVAGDWDAAESLVDRALAVNSNLPMAWAERAMVSLALGQHVDALEQAQKSIQLSPIDPRQWFAQMLMAFAFLMQGRYEEALSMARKGRTARPDNAPLAMALACALALSGRIAEAHAVMTEILGRNPAMRLASLPRYAVFQRPEDMARFIQAMSLAGMPD